MLLAALVDNTFNSFYFAPDDVESLRRLHEVIDITSRAGIELPKPDRFMYSLFQDGGWGRQLSSTERDA